MNDMKYENDLDGVLSFEGIKVPFHYDGGNLAIQFGEHTELPEGDCVNFIGQEHGMLIGGYILFHLTTPLLRDIGSYLFSVTLRQKILYQGLLNKMLTISSKITILIQYITK